MVRKEYDTDEEKSAVDDFFDTASFEGDEDPATDEKENESKSLWWWFLFAPGKALLWFEYMTPKSVGDSFGSARRKDVPLFQFIGSIVLYLLLAAVLYGCLVSR